jgi:hypothetical protein
MKNIFFFALILIAVSGCERDSLHSPGDGMNASMHSYEQSQPEEMERGNCQNRMQPGNAGPRMNGNSNRHNPKAECNCAHHKSQSSGSSEIIVPVSSSGTEQSSSSSRSKNEDEDEDGNHQGT